MHLCNGRISPALAARLRAQDQKERDRLERQQMREERRAARAEARSTSGLKPDEATRLFWDHVDTSGGPSACHPWTGATDATWTVYTLGKFHHPSFATTLAHRIAVALTFGIELPPDVYVAPECEDRLCCNVDHLTARTTKRGAKPVPVRLFCQEVADVQTQQAA